MVTELCARHVGGVATTVSSCRSAMTWPGPAAGRPEDRRPAAAAGMRTLAITLGRLPGGTSVTVRDVNGREWSITPARTAPAAELRRAA